MIHPSKQSGVWNADQPDEFAAWLGAWNTWENREVFAHPAYVRLFAEPGDRTLCAWYDTPGGGVMYPFICRRLPEDLDQLVNGAIYHDLTSPYGFGGAFIVGNERSHDVANGFWSHFDRWCSEQAVVTEFVRLMPTPNTVLPFPGEQRERSMVVIRSLELDESELWMAVEHKVRKNVKRARKNNITIEVDIDGSRIGDFLRIYYGTMDRRNASSTYYFRPEMFDAIHRSLAGSFAYFHAIHESRVVATELVLLSAQRGYSFLGGTDSAAFDLRPNDLLKYEIMRWCKQHGKSDFVLGGGATPGDGIYRYKLSFAPDGAVPFQTGERILNDPVYRALVASRTTATSDSEQSPDSGPSYFPAYRR